MKSEKLMIFGLCLVIIIIGLVFILCVSNPNSSQISPIKLKQRSDNQDYRIIDKIEKCEGGYEEFYHDDDYVYYFNCTKKDKINLVWEDGTITKMMDELSSGNISLDSLIKHGLLHNRKSLHEEENNTNETLEENNTNKN